MQTDRIKVNNNLPVIAGVKITTDNEGRFNLNALHKASGLGDSKKPSEWLRGGQAQELITELEAENPATKFTNIIKGRGITGTFAHELLAISYAGWISPAFQLKVNQVFLDYRTGKLQHNTLDLNNPGQLRGLLANYAERIELAEAEVKRLSFENEGLNEDSKALARIKSPIWQGSYSSASIQEPEQEQFLICNGLQTQWADI